MIDCDVEQRTAEWWIHELCGFVMLQELLEHDFLQVGWRMNFLLPNQLHQSTV